MLSMLAIATMGQDPYVILATPACSTLSAEPLAGGGPPMTTDTCSNICGRTDDCGLFSVTNDTCLQYKSSGMCTGAMYAMSAELTPPCTSTVEHNLRIATGVLASALTLTHTWIAYVHWPRWTKWYKGTAPKIATKSACAFY